MFKYKKRILRVIDGPDDTNNIDITVVNVYRLAVLLSNHVVNRVILIVAVLLTFYYSLSQ